MIERGKRVPSIDMLEVIAQVFQKNPTWFLDDESEQQAIAPDKGNRGGISGMALEPSFLFSNDILQVRYQRCCRKLVYLAVNLPTSWFELTKRAIKTTSLIERAAEEVGLKRLNLGVEDLIDIARNLGIQISWVTTHASGAWWMSSESMPSNWWLRFLRTTGYDFLERNPQSTQLDWNTICRFYIGHCICIARRAQRCVVGWEQRYMGRPTRYRDLLSELSRHSSALRLRIIASLLVHCCVQSSI